MKQEEIIEGNKLIAEFMGLEFISKQDSYADYGWWKIGTFIEGNSKNNSNFICISDYKLKYNSDWNWLMPVVNKIGNLVGSGLYYHKLIMNLTIFASLEDTYISVIEFIKWYNENKKQDAK